MAGKLVRSEILRIFADRVLDYDIKGSRCGP